MPEHEDGPGLRRLPIRQLGARLRDHECRVATRQMPCQHVDPGAAGRVSDTQRIGPADHPERPADGKPCGQPRGNRMIRIHNPI